MSIIHVKNHNDQFIMLPRKAGAVNFLSRATASISALAMLLFAGFALSGCGGSSGGSGLSSEVVSGVATVGAPMSGKVSLKDSSTIPQVKTTVIASDGSFAIDVTGMKAPFMLQGEGTAGGNNYKLSSYAEGAGIANINPLSDAIVASAANVDDPSEAYEKDDADRHTTIRNNLQGSINALMAKLQPLLKRYNAQNSNPITSRYIANHLDLDDMFDHVKITVKSGILSIINDKTGAIIFTGKVSDIANGNFYPENVPPAPAIPVVPVGVTALGGANQATISWNSVSAATSYNIYYATTAGVTTANGTKIANAASPYVQSGLNTGASYYYIVTAVNSTGESAASAQVSATTSTAPPVPAVPAAPVNVRASGGTNQATISWSTVSGATSYNIYYATTSGVTKGNGTKIANATTPAVHGGLTAGTTYYYIVTAVNGVGEGAASVQVAATTLTPVPVPTTPAVPTVSTVGGANQVTVSWPAVTGATSYNVYQSTTSGVTTANGTKTAGVTSPYVNTGLAAGTAYYYVVTAVNSAGESAASAQVTATTNAAPPPASCTTCHATPPATGKHAFHTFTSCGTCHGSGYSATTVNAATHMDGVKTLGGTSGWDATSRSCANSCHGSRAW